MTAAVEGTRRIDAGYQSPTGIIARSLVWWGDTGHELLDHPLAELLPPAQRHHAIARPGARSDPQDLLRVELHSGGAHHARLPVELGFCPDQSRQINRLAAGRGCGEEQPPAAAPEVGDPALSAHAFENADLLLQITELAGELSQPARLDLGLGELGVHGGCLGEERIDLALVCRWQLGILDRKSVV